MIIIDKPARDALEPSIREATQNGKIPASEWHKKFFDTLAGLLEKDPMIYRAWGIWWWLMKKELADHGHNTFGDIYTDWAEAMDYGDTSLNIAAAYTYFEYVTEDCFLYAPYHPYNYHDTKQDEQAGEIVWETGTFFVSDPDMDARGPF